MNKKITNSIENYEKALRKLHEFIDEPVQNDRDRAGIIQAFEFTFELAWKTLQKICQYEGLESGGPRTIIKQSFSIGLIDNKFEKNWLQMLEDRNLMSHVYREEVSQEVSLRIQEHYKDTFDELLKKFIGQYLSQK